MNVLIVGHACSPRLGSEPGFTWNWAWHLASRHRVWVVTHPQYRRDIEEYLALNPGKDIRFIWVTPPAAIDPWQPSRSERWVRLHYLIWLQAAYRTAERLHRDARFDVCHHVSLGTVIAPPPLWRMPGLKVWGPIGGGQKAPVEFRRYYGAQWRKQTIRDVALRLLPYTRRLRRAIEAASLILATNGETVQLLRTAGATNVRLYLDCGIAARPSEELGDRVVRGSEMTLLWAGRLEERKGLPVVFEALAQQRSLPLKLLIAGDGPARSDWEHEVQRMGLAERVVFCGRVPYAEMPTMFRRADAFVFSSLCDSFGSVVLEAMSYGLPVITLDHQGVGAIAPAEAAIKVPVTTPERTAVEFGQAMEELFRAPDRRESMGTAARKFALTHLWTRKAEQMSAWYEELADEDSDFRLSNHANESCRRMPSQDY